MNSFSLTARNLISAKKFIIGLPPSQLPLFSFHSVSHDQ